MVRCNLLNFEQDGFKLASRGFKLTDTHVEKDRDIGHFYWDFQRSHFPWWQWDQLKHRGLHAPWWFRQIRQFTKQLHRFTLVIILSLWCVRGTNYAWYYSWGRKLAKQIVKSIPKKDHIFIVTSTTRSTTIPTIDPYCDWLQCFWLAFYAY